MSNLGDLLDFLASPTPFHVVAAARQRLESATFAELRMEDAWGKLSPGGYFIVHCDTSVVAFVVPDARAHRSFRMIGAHTDSPNLRLKPKAEYTKEGYAQLGVEVYGGALVNSWLDRDLGLAGRVVVRTKGGRESRLVRFHRPLCRVAQLAIHLDRDVTEKGVVLNRQEHLAPIFGLGVESEPLRALLASELHAKKSDLLASDLMLYDLTAPCLGGPKDEFIFSARLDNLAMCHAALMALLGANENATKRKGRTPRGKGGVERSISLVSLFDHEEVGSQSVAGAQSSFLPRVLERIVLALGGSKETEHRMLARSFCISADMAHAVHPNYAERHEARHKPTMNSGPVIKVNAQQRYATSGETAALFLELARAAIVPTQHYAHRTDLPCGSTIGPITSTLLGIPTADVGNAMLSMHSAREMAGSRDPALMEAVLRKFLEA